MTKFTDLDLAAPLVKALESEGYTTPTPIQAKAIPAVMTGTDLLGIAQTGTGKTAAFALPILHALATNPRPAPQKGCRVLVLSPTRELASQIADSFRVYGRNMRVSVTTIFGGVSQGPQVRALARGVDVLVATPGRLLDLMGQGVVNLSKTEVLVLDEADQMLDLGFVKPIRTIVARLPSDRQTLFFSATMPREITKLAHEFLNDPVKVTVTPVASTVDRINQQVIQIEAKKKRALLSELLNDPEMSRTLVFTRTKRGADRVAKHLEAGGVTSAAIHGNKSQRQRERALHAFREGKTSVLVATDIAARGIDIDGVSHVINFELPEVAEAYVHRIGRTARAGASGSAISLCDAAERHLLRAIEKLTRQSIPSQDRRNDDNLTIEKVEKRGPRPPQQARKSHGGGRPGRGGRSDGQSAGRADSRSAGRADGRGAGRADSRNAGRADGRSATRDRKSYDPMDARNSRTASGGQSRSGDGRSGDSRPGVNRTGGTGGDGRNSQGTNNTGNQRSRQRVAGIPGSIHGGERSANSKQAKPGRSGSARSASAHSGSGHSGSGKSGSRSNGQNAGQNQGNRKQSEGRGASKSADGARPHRDGANQKNRNRSHRNSTRQPAATRA